MFTPERWVRRMEVQLDGPAHLFALLEQLSHEPRCFVVHGCLRDEVADAERIRTIGSPRDGDPVFLRDCQRHFFEVDLDHLPLPPHLDVRLDGEDLLLYTRERYLPKELRGVACWAQLSGSTGMRPGEYGAHFWYWSETPYSSWQYKEYIRSAAAAGYTHLDTGIYSPYCRLTVAEPVFLEGREDTLVTRPATLPGEPMARLPILSSSVPSRGQGRRDYDGGDELLAGDFEKLYDELPSCQTTERGRAIMVQAAAAIAAAPRGQRNTTLFGEVVRLFNQVGFRQIAKRDAVWAAAFAIPCDLVEEEPAKTAGTILRAIQCGLTGTPLGRLVRDRRTVNARVEELGRSNTQERHMPADTELPAGTVAVFQADLGAGKTERIAREARALDGTGVLAVCHRRGLVETLGERLAIPTHMEMPPEQLAEDGSLAICADSICRLPSDYVPSLLVLEECELTAHHIYQREQGTIPRSQHTRRAHTGEVHARLAQLGRQVLARGGRIVICDAFAAERTRTAIKILFGEDAPVRWVVHQHPRNEYTIHQYTRSHDLLYAVEEMVQQGKRLFIPCTTRAQANLVTQRLGWTGNAPGGHIYLYTAQVIGDARIALKQPSVEWRTAQVVVCSPTVDSGLDYSPVDPADNFDAVVLFAPLVRGIGWTALLQMCARARGTTDIHAYVQDPNREEGAARPSLLLEDIDKSFETAYLDDLGTVTRAGIGQVPIADEAKTHWDMSVVVERERRIYEHDVAGGFYGWWRARGARVVPGPGLPMDREKAATYVAGLCDDRWRDREQYVHEYLDALLMSSWQYELYREPKDLDELLSYQHSRLARLVGPDLCGLEHPTRLVVSRGFVTKDSGPPLVRPVTPVDEDRCRHLTRVLHRRKALVLLLARERDLLARGAYRALLTGYPAHATGETRKTEYMAALLLHDGWDLRAMLAPLPRGVTPDGIERFSTLTRRCDTLSSADDLRNSFLAAVKQCGGTRDTLRAAGINLKKPWGELRSQALRYFGERLEQIDQARDAAAGKDKTKGNARVRRYRLDTANHEWIAALSMVSTARRLGADIDPLAQDHSGQSTWRGDEWRVAVDPETGWWRRVERDEATRQIFAELCERRHVSRSIFESGCGVAAVSGGGAPMQC